MLLAWTEECLAGGMGWHLVVATDGWSVSSFPGVRQAGWATVGEFSPAASDGSHQLAAINLVRIRAVARLRRAHRDRVRQSPAEPPRWDCHGDCWAVCRTRQRIRLAGGAVRGWHGAPRWA